MMTQILLNQDLRVKVENRIKECFEIASKHYDHTFDTMPEIRFNVKSRTAGLAYHKDWLLRFNLILLVENEEHFLAQTVTHEVAHLVNRTVNKVPANRKRLSAHGKEWKSVMTDCFKIPADRCHTYDVSSIEKFPRKEQSLKSSRLTRTLAMFNKLSPEDKRFFLNTVEV